MHLFYLAAEPHPSPTIWTQRRDTLMQMPLERQKACKWALGKSLSPCVFVLPFRFDVAMVTPDAIAMGCVGCGQA
jgi:hypothetical protein